MCIRDRDIFIKPVNLASVESIFKTRILETPGVEKLTVFSMDFDSVTRYLRVEFTAETIYGVIDKEKVTINV